MKELYTKNDILNQLNSFEIPKEKIVLIHTSLRSIGSIEGGPKALLDIFIEYFTSNGGLFCVPTHTWANKGNKITLNMNSEQTCLGAFSDISAADGRGIRSENPTHSVMIFGDKSFAESLIKNELNVSSGTAPESFYGKVIENDGCILLVGVSHNRNTCIHCVEEILKIPNRLSQSVKSVTIKRKSGEILRRELRSHFTSYTSDVSLRFPKYETAFRYHKAIKDGFIGNAPTQACSAKIIKNTMALIQSRCNGIDVLENESPIPQKYYTI